MILFKLHHVMPILDGVKTETRRIWLRPRVKVGSIHRAKIEMLSKDFFAMLKIKSVHREAFQSVTEEDAMNEGGYTREEFMDLFFKINPNVEKITFGGKIPFNVWVVKFERVENGQALDI